MKTLPLALVASNSRSPLLGAYNLWANADFRGCLEEVAVAEQHLDAPGSTEANILRARAYLRLDRPAEALKVLGTARAADADVDVRCALSMLHGIALLSLGRAVAGLALLKRTVDEASESNVRLPVLLEANYQLGFGYWLAGRYDEADTVAGRVAESAWDIVAARSIALRGWVRVGRTQYAEALEHFRRALRAYGTCAARDSAFEASLVHAIATYELEVVENGFEPKYYVDDLPRVPNGALDVYRLLVGAVDAQRAALGGDEARAIDAAIATEAADVGAAWRVFGLALRARIAAAFGYPLIVRATALTAFALAADVDWSGAPAESRFGLLDLAEVMSSIDVEKARHCIASFSRISVPLDPRYFGGRHPVQRAGELHARGVVEIALRRSDGIAMLNQAAELYEGLGFAWRAAESRLAVGEDSSGSSRRAYEHARAFIMERFPRSHLARRIPGYRAPIDPGGMFGLTPAQCAIVQALCAGRTTRQIALERGTSIGTVYNQLKDLYRRTNLHSIGEVVRFFSATESPRAYDRGKTDVADRLVSKIV